MFFLFLGFVAISTKKKKEKRGIWDPKKKMVMFFPLTQKGWEKTKTVPNYELPRWTPKGRGKIWISSVAQVEIGFPKWVSKVGLFVDECLFFEPLLSTNIMTWTEIKGALKNWIVFFSECCFWYILSGDCCLMIHQISWKHEDVPNVHFPLPVGLNLFRNLSRWNAYLLRCFFQDWIYIIEACWYLITRFAWIWKRCTLAEANIAPENQW